MRNPFHPSRPTLTLLAGAAVVAALSGCASRAVPERFPPGSALSPDAPTPRVQPLNVALDGEPPLPGESRPGWGGLDSAAGEAAAVAPAAPAAERGHAH